MSDLRPRGEIEADHSSEKIATIEMDRSKHNKNARERHNCGPDFRKKFPKQNRIIAAVSSSPCCMNYIIPQTVPRTKMYNGEIHQASGGAVRWSRNGGLQIPSCAGGAYRRQDEQSLVARMPPIHPNPVRSWKRQLVKDGSKVFNNHEILHQSPDFRKPAEKRSIL